MVAAGDKVVVRVTVRGTHTGALDLVRLAMPATNRTVTFEAIHILRLEDGVIVEHWAARDDIAFLRQLGLTPTRVPAADAAAPAAAEVAS